jgi:uncharacterized membrane protein YbaN (DUF454 family)
MFFGFISLALGVLGIFLPLLPTTPFLLLSAALFARSSPRFYNLLLNHKVLGTYIRGFLVEKSIPLRIKILSISFLWTTILGSIFFGVEKTWLQLLLVAIALVVTFHILSFKTTWNYSTSLKGIQINSVTKWLKIHAREFLFGGLGLLLLTGMIKWLDGPPCFIRLLFGLAIFCKVLFLVVNLSTKRKFEFSLPLKFILTGVALILLSYVFKVFFPDLLFRKLFFYLAIIFKSVGLLLLLFFKKK